MDVGGPAVSNQWVLNRACAAVMDNTDCTRAIVQLTGLGKLDVEISQDRMAELVLPDRQRNFVIDGIWPSSVSLEHESKKLWRQWLCSPRLEVQDIQIKARLLADFCQNRNIELILIQGYPVEWSSYQAHCMLDLIDNPDQAWYEHYKASDRYQHHDHSASNTVPELGWQLEHAQKMSRRYWPEIFTKISKLTEAFYT